MDFSSFRFLWWLCIGDSWWFAYILNCCVCRNCASRRSAFIWAVAVLICFLFLLVYRCVHVVAVFGTVGTGDYGSVIDMLVVVGKGLGEGAGKEQGEENGKEQGRV